MYDNSRNPESNPTTQPMFPRRPHVDDPRWRDVAVRSRSQSQTNIKRFPTETQGVEITTIYAGDTISIMPEIQYQYYVAARVGYHVGWVNFKHVKLISLRSSASRYLEETKPTAPDNRDRQIAKRRAEMAVRAVEARNRQYVEEETQPAPAQIPRKPPPIARNDVKRIIDKLKSLGGLLGKR